MTEQPEIDEAKALKAAIFKAISQHLQEHGPTDWHLVQERAEFSHVIGKGAGLSGRRKFFRWRKRASELVPPDRTRPRDGRAAAAAHIAWADAMVLHADGAGSPLSASVGYVARKGHAGLQKLDLLAETLQRVIQDIDLVRAATLVDDPMNPGMKKVTDAPLLLKATLSLLQALNTATRLQNEINNVRQSGQFYAGLVTMLTTELASTPALLVRILQRMDELNRGLGGTSIEVI